MASASANPPRRTEVYRCQVCAAISLPQRSQRRHVVYRRPTLNVPGVRIIASLTVRPPERNGPPRPVSPDPGISRSGCSVEREVPVCDGCGDLLDRGLSLAAANRMMAKVRAERLFKPGRDAPTPPRPKA